MMVALQLNLGMVWSKTGFSGLVSYLGLHGLGGNWPKSNRAGPIWGSCCYKDWFETTPSDAHSL